MEKHKNEDDDSESEKAAFPYGKAGPSNDEVIFRMEKNLGGALSYYQSKI
jgi:hypothetical protein